MPTEFLLHHSGERDSDMDYNDKPTRGKIAYIVPSEAAIENVSAILSDEISAGIIDVMMVDIHDPESEYRRLCSEGYSCIIARGGTYMTLHGVAGAVPLVEERIRTSDILQMIADADMAPGEPYYVVLYRNTADGIENMVKLSAGSCHICRYHDLTQLTEMLEDLPGSGVNVFSSGYAKAVSDRTDLNFIEILNRPHTIHETVRTAGIFLEQLQKNVQQVNTLNSIYNNIDEGILIFDASEQIAEVNERALILLGMDRASVIGKQVKTLVREMPAKRKDSRCSIDSPRNFTGKLGSTLISYTVYPFDFYRGETRYIMTLQDVTKIQTLEQSIRFQLSKKGLVAEHSFEDILTCDPGMQHVIDKAQTVAAHEGSVLIYGESGTGKELFAQSIHNASRRSSGPFVAVNCSALSESLLESELFGYVGGSFTGARKEGKAGLFELAHNGTIFLDEINSTPLSLQTKILRVIESQQVMRVGSDYVIPLNVRIISASNGNLEESIESGQFRRDLYYRLNTFELTVPPVRERQSDILLLFRYYLSRFSDAPADTISIDPDFEKQLLSHSWLGNVREIRSTALRYNAFNGDNSAGEILKNTGIPAPAPVRSSIAATAASALPEIPEAADPDTDTLQGDMISLAGLSAAVEKLVIQSLENKGLSRTDIAKALGISRQALYKKMNKE